MLRYSVKVSSGPGTAGYENLTPTQRNKQTPWAAFTLSTTAEGFAADLRKNHPTWIVTVHDLENERYQRQQAAAREEEAARASVADQQRHEWKTAQRNREYLDRPEFAHAPNQPQRASLLSPEEDAVIAILEGYESEPIPACNIHPGSCDCLQRQPPRASSVDEAPENIKDLTPEELDEVGRTILRNASDYLYNRQQQPRTAETADPADAQAVDAMDDIRAEWEPREGARDPRNDRPSTDADDENDDSKPEPQDEDADGHITAGEKATGTE